MKLEIFLSVYPYADPNTRVGYSVWTGPLAGGLSPNERRYKVVIEVPDDVPTLGPFVAEEER